MAGKETRTIPAISNGLPKKVKEMMIKSWSELSGWGRADTVVIVPALKAIVSQEIFLGEENFCKVLKEKDY